MPGKKDVLIIYNYFHNILRVFDQFFLSPQAKQCAIITYQHRIYVFPHELPNNLKVRIFAAGGELPTQEKKKLRS